MSTTSNILDSNATTSSKISKEEIKLNSNSIDNYPFEITNNSLYTEKILHSNEDKKLYNSKMIIVDNCNNISTKNN